MRRSLAFILIALLPHLAAAQSLEFHAPGSVNDPSTAAVMRDLASRIIPVYRNDDRERYLDNLAALQLVAGSFESAYSARLELRGLRQGSRCGSDDGCRRPPVDPALVYDLYAHAKSLQSEYHLAFAQAFDLAFWETIPIFDNLDGYRVESWLELPAVRYARALQASFDALRGRSEVSEAEALQLIWRYIAFDAYRSFAPIVPGLISLDDDRRYIIQDDVEIEIPGRRQVLARLVRPRSSSGLLTTLLEYRIAPGRHRDAIEAAAYGFAGMVAFTPTVRVGRHAWRVIPFEREGEQVRAVIGWIAKQPWSDAQVGMYGDGYSGFAAWAAAKRLPPELKAIAVSDPMAPGIDFPTDGGIALNRAYCWLQKIETAAQEEGASADPPPNPAAPGTRPWCRALNQQWYASGKPYRDLPRLAGRPSAIFRHWLAHPGYDFYWRRLAPTPREFARIDVPVLSLTGYFARGEAGTLFYFLQHDRYNPHADDTLLLGPYDRGEMRRAEAAPIVRGYRSDPVALIDLRAIEFQWFEYLFLNGEKPALLTSRVNFEIMGANEWRHASSLAALANSRVRLYLAADRHGGAGRLTPREPSGRAAVELVSNLVARRDGAQMGPESLLSGRVPVENGVAFVSGPLPGGLEIDGRFSGQLQVRVNKLDVDLALSLYELLPDGGYLRLFSPPEEFRASYLEDRRRRRLLAPGRLEGLAFTTERLTAVRVESGARLVMVLQVNKRPDQQINYGTGGAVSGESIASGRIPVRLRLLRGSYLDLPLTQAPPAGQ